MEIAGKLTKVSNTGYVMKLYKVRCKGCRTENVVMELKDGALKCHCSYCGKGMPMRHLDRKEL